jgi:uncharacterized protein involved in outer membrane biogenesis
MTLSLPRSPLRLALWALAILSGALTLLLLIATLALPGWLTGRGVQLASESLGRPVQVDEAHFQPWRLALVLQGVRIAGATAAEPPLFTLEQLDAALSLRSLLRGRAVVESLTLTRPALRMTRTAIGRYDIDDLLQRFAAKPGASEADEPEFALYNIELVDGQVLFDDRPVKRQHKLTGLHLALPFLSTLPADVQVQVQPRLRGVLDGVAFDSQAEALPFADVSRGRLSLKLAGLDLAPLAAYVPDSAPVRLQAGRLDLELALDFTEQAKQAPNVKLSGLVQLHDLAVTQPDGTPWFDAKLLRLPLADVQPLRRQAGLGSIVLEAPRLQWHALPAAADATPAAPAAPWQASLAGLAIRAGHLAWRDLALDDVEVLAGAAAWPLKDAAQVQASARLDQARFTAQVNLSPQHLQLDATLQQLALERLSPWMPLPGGARLSAVLSTDLGVKVADPLAPGAAERVQLALTNLTLADARLSVPGTPALARLASLQLDQASLDPATRSVTLGQLALDAPRLQLSRDADGRLNTDPLLPPPDDAAPAGTPWKVRVAGVSVDHGAVRWRDLAVPAAMRAIAVAVEPVKLKLGALSWPATAPVSAQVTAQLAPLGGDERPVQASAGTLQWSGRVALAPLAFNGALQMRALPLHVFNAYLDPAWGLQLQRAELGARAEIEARQESPGAWAATLDGDVRIGPLALLQARVIDGERVVGEDLLSWQSLQLDGVRLALAPNAAPRMAVREAQLDDAYARLIINEQGRFNLRDIRPADAASAPAPSAPASAASAPAAEFSAERIRVNRGIVDFSDRFVRPNYSARLSELQGSLGAFSSTSPAMAPLTVRGKVAGTGLLEIDGQLKPGAPLAMDIAANATDIELAPLSPYAAKYAGYAIERGKLSTKLRYQVQPGGELQASNQIILNQLTFGERVDSPDATSLPVRFAVALLKDRDGVIDVNLPVSGSLNDPQFSVGGLVWKLFLNLIGKALTSPFSLFSGSERPEEAQVFFQPGGAELAAVDQLDRVAKLLIERPGVQLSLTGWAGIAAESQAMREQRLDRALRAENAPTPDAALRRLYQAAKLPNKPRNVLGLVKDLPAEQMRGLLLGSYTVDDEALRQLAVARATAVRDALLARGAPNARVFLTAPKVCDQACDETWRPHVELSLGVH